MLTNNQIKDIIKVIINSQEVGFLNFLRPLMTASLPLMKNVRHHQPKEFWYLSD